MLEKHHSFHVFRYLIPGDRKEAPFSLNHPVDPPISWEDWSDLFFHLAVIAKKNIDNINLLKPKERHYPQPLILKKLRDGKDEQQKNLRLEKKQSNKKRFDDKKHPN